MGVTTFGFTKVAVIDTRCYYNIRQSEEPTLSLTLWDNDKQKTMILSVQVVIPPSNVSIVSSRSKETVVVSTSYCGTSGQYETDMIMTKCRLGTL